MNAPDPPITVRGASNSELAATVARERSKLGNFIRRRVRDSMDAEDLLQDVLQELVEAYRLPEPIEQAGAWLFRVARNRIIDRFRKNRRRPLVDMKSIELADGEYLLDLALPRLDQSPDALYQRSMVLDALERAVDELPASQRDVFIGHELEGISFKEMARTSGIPVNTLLTHKRNAVLHLRQRLKTIYDDLET